MDDDGVWRKLKMMGAKPILVLAGLVFTSLIIVGAGPRQGNVPPQPFFPDTIFGSVTVQGTPAPINAELVACIDDCENVFESVPVLLLQNGSFSNLKVNPEDQTLVGHPIAFYLVNEYGRIQAAETITFRGGPDIHSVRLTFSQAMPIPTPTPTLTPTAALPATGDPVVIVIPKVVLLTGVSVVLAGLFLLCVARQRGF